MPHPFDPGYVAEPFLTLCAQYPEVNIYPTGQFRLEWGPIFHRGRLDGSARLLVIGQDPAQHETIVRRILVGEAGRRVQGLLAKLGIMHSYVLINAYLSSPPPADITSMHLDVLSGFVAGPATAPGAGSCCKALARLRTWSGAVSLCDCGIQHLVRRDREG